MCVCVCVRMQVCLSVRVPVCVCVCAYARRFLHVSYECAVLQSVPGGKTVTKDAKGRTVSKAKSKK